MLSRGCLCAFARACEDCQTEARHVEGTTAASGGFRLSLPASHGFSVSGCSPSLLLNGFAFVVAPQALVSTTPRTRSYAYHSIARARFRSGKANPRQGNSGVPRGLPDGGYMRKQPASGTAHIHGFDPSGISSGAGFDGELPQALDLWVDRSRAGKKPRDRGAGKGLCTQLKQHAGQSVPRGTIISGACGQRTPAGRNNVWDSRLHNAGMQHRTSRPARAHKRRTNEPAATVPSTARASATRHHERLIPSSRLSDVDQAFARDLPSGLYPIGQKRMLRLPCKGKPSLNR